MLFWAMSQSELMQNVARYFADARERQSILRKRQRGESWPWSEKEEFQKIYLCCVHREDDKTTAWFRENVRSKQGDLELNIFAATVLFRWFNRISTGEFLFKQSATFNIWLDRLIQGVHPNEAGAWLAEQLETYVMRPFFTGAYMIKTDNAMVKHHAVAVAASRVVNSYIDLANQEGRVHFDTLEGWTKWLKRHHGLGGFMAYEVVSDLRWTPLADKSTDIMTWANVGPGCARGFSRLYYGDPDNGRGFYKDPRKAQEVMAWIVELSQREEYWPQNETPWEARTAEHWSCEFDKIERYRNQEGRIKRWYRK